MYSSEITVKFMKDRTAKINDELDKLVKNVYTFGEAHGMARDEMNEEVDLIRKFQSDWAYKFRCLRQFDK